MAVFKLNEDRPCKEYVDRLLGFIKSTLESSLLSICHSLFLKDSRINVRPDAVLPMDPIEISSSDSDFEMDDGGGNDQATSGYRASSFMDDSGENDRSRTNHRVPPLWASPSNGNLMYTGRSGLPPSESSLVKAAGSNGISRNVPESNFHARSVVNDRGRASHQNSDVNSSRFPSHDGNSVQTPRINSQISSSSGGDYERLSSQQALSRTFAPRPSASDSKGHMREINEINDDEVVMLESRSSRVLPPSVMPGKSTFTPQYGSSADPLYRPAMVEERLNRNDERLIYQAALEDLNQPKVEATLPDGLLSVPLLRHQKIALAWMLQKETRSLHCLGGILADDQGLGKTVSMIALIQMQKLLETQSKPESSNHQKTEALNLDDDDDDEANGTSESGKVQESAESNDSKPSAEVSTSMQSFSRQRPAAGTLVVCPASVLRQWARELDEKVDDQAKLDVLVYHGGNRTKDPVELAKYDVVLTTYAIVTIEVPKQPLVDEDEADEKNEDKYGISSEFSAKKRKKAFNAGKKGKKGKKGIDSSLCGSDFGPLARVGWFRVILDEAQTIKNHRTQVARACCSLRAKRRWCLSGTPIQNAIDDLYSYFRFLKYEPYAAYKSFYNTIKIPISRNSLHGYKKLQAVLRAIMLRRTKGTLIDGEPIITLPPKSVNLKKVDFSLEERDFYTQLETASRSQFKAFAAAGTVKQNYASILLMLLRLRQACDHPLLVKADSSASVGKVSGEMAKKLPKDALTNLLKILEEAAVCQQCSDTPEDPVITMCGHVFCYQCVSEYLTGDDNMCPESKCKEQLSPDFVYTKATLRSCISSGSVNGSTSSQPAVKSWILDTDYTSSKIKAVLQILQDHCIANAGNPEFRVPMDHDIFDSEDDVVEVSCGSVPNVVKRTTIYSTAPTDGPIKTIIFSQWTGMLDLVEFSLNQFCVRFRRLDGTMSLAARDRAVKDFNTDPEVTVMLMSLKAGNLGLNMVAACHVILLDLWWNPTTEDQAVDRAHRIGQTRPVTVTRITIKDTVEDRILSLQDEKRKMVASAFGEDQGGSSGTRLTVEDLKYLFMI